MGCRIYRRRYLYNLYKKKPLKRKIYIYIIRNNERVIQIGRIILIFKRRA